MHYFKFHIKDYYANTGHLTDDADLCYRRLLDYYYLNDGVLPELKMLAKKVRLSKKEDIVQEILDEFFTFENGIYTHKRADKELFEYKEKANTNKRIAQEREAKKRKSKEQECEPVVHEACTVREPVVHESPPNHKPLTINQEPLTNNQKPKVKDKDKGTQDKLATQDKPAVSKFDAKKELSKLGVSDIEIDEYLRRRKKAGKETTVRVIQTLINEVERYNKVHSRKMDLQQVITLLNDKCWLRFEHDWLIDAPKKNQETIWEKGQRLGIDMHETDTNDTKQIWGF
jgi:uncharacterized protein YdaU (DUF1376 family)